MFTHGTDLCFIVGDVSGKGISAAMLMAHLHATFRALISQVLPLGEVMERASRIFCESTLPTHFATLACGRASATGEVELCIAGHLPALICQESGVERIDATGLPLGMFCDERFSVSRTHLEPGDCILLYTDGLSETVDRSGSEYGVDRLTKVLECSRSITPQEIISACLADLASFRGDTPRNDDLTILVLTRAESSSDKGSIQ
jgi:sigma-B regulation protein RsbU (phosphoserine phosphatase)